MKIQIIIFIATIFFILNTYYDGKFINTMKTWKKYYQMIGIAFIGLSIYLFTKNNPNNVRDLFTYTNNIIKYMPIDKDANKFISPLLNIIVFYSIFPRIIIFFATTMCTANSFF